MTMLPTKPIEKRTPASFSTSFFSAAIRARYLTADLFGTLASWPHARLRETCHVNIMPHIWIHLIITDEVHKGIGVKSIKYYVRVRTLRWVGHVARMDKTPFTKALALTRLPPARFLRVVEARPRPAEVSRPLHCDVGTRPHRKRRYFNEKGHTIRESNSNTKQDREKTNEQQMKQQTRALCTSCRACLIPARYWESISSVVQFSSNLLAIR
jgi:hypothetical protein